MEGEHTLTIICVILAMDYASIQLNDSLKIPRLSIIPKMDGVQEINTL